LPFERNLPVNRVCVKVDDRKAHFKVTPDQVAKFDPKGCEAFGVKKCLNVWVTSTPQKRFEVNHLRAAVVELQAYPIATDGFGLSDIDDRRRHFNLLVIRSDWNILCSTK